MVPGATAAGSERMLHRRFVLRGVVQGVGFRPHVARVASHFAVTGVCGNDDTSVFIEAEGEQAELDAFLAAVCAELPPLARVDSVETSELAPGSGGSGFHIVESRSAAGAPTLVPPDIARCDDCVRELNDPADRRYRHPFISCASCGPRFSIIRDLPYDRARTTLAAFPMCPACAAEYSDPLNRRFHAESISCFDCGPRLWLETSAGEIAEWGDAIEAARRMLAEGLIVAVKGLGGFTLLCDARNEGAVARLRRRKRRPEKPLAVLAASAPDAVGFAELDDDQLSLLAGPQRPIVLAPKARGYDLAPSVAPALADIGVMLPSAPVHDLLVRDGEVRVATSGNGSGEPISYRNDDARRALAGVADAFLMNDREIHVPVEDSVVMADRRGVVPVRRSRGFAPLPVALPDGRGAGTVVAVGGELKNTFAVTRDDLAFVSAHIGDMGALGTQRAFERSVGQLVAAQRCEPELLVADLHPEYRTGAWAERHSERTGVELLRVQHHHAHALSLAAEHRMADRPLLCAVFDGTGYGPDGTVWGGELLRVAGTSFERVWHLPQFWLPGGDSAVRNPWKSAIALLAEFGIAPDGLPPVEAAAPAELALVRSQLESRTAISLTSSAGRLFDAVASLLGVRQHSSYEGQAAMELEHAARRCGHDEHAGSDCEGVEELIATLADGVRAGRPVPCLARSFHAALGTITARALLTHLGEATAVGLTGGVFQNRLLTRHVVTRIRSAAPGVRVLTHSLVPANDGGLSLGQAVAGHLTLTARRAAGRTRGTAAVPTSEPDARREQTCA